MAAVIAALLSSPLAARYEFTAIPTYRDSRPLRRLLFFARSLLALCRWCCGEGPRVVHVHMAARGSMYRKAAVVVAARAMRRPVVLHVHAGPGDLVDFLERLDGRRRAVLRVAFALSHDVLSVSASGAAVLNRMLTDVAITVVPNAPPPLTASGSSRGEGSKVLFLGGFDDPAKGGAVLVAALPELFARRPDARVVLAGPGVAPADLPSRVEAIGWLDREAKERALAEADLFVMPSISEGMPVALLEAMSHGLPIVASRVGGIPEVVDEGVEACLLEPGDAGELGATLAELLGDAERRRALGAAAAERARRLADEDVYGQLDRIYLRAIR